MSDRRGPVRLLALARRLLRDRRGVTAIEYGLIAAIIVIGMFAAVSQMANGTIRMWNHIDSKVAEAR
jgi:pilus assembly protein Flp/PilA